MSCDYLMYLRYPIRLAYNERLLNKTGKGTRRKMNALREFSSLMNIYVVCINYNRMTKVHKVGWE
jgi:hypothetical protein